MKILLTGSTGLLGKACHSLFTQLGAKVEVLDRKVAWDIAHQPKKALLKLDQVLVHTAANTDVEHCELAFNECYRDNYLLTEGLAHACYLSKTRMVYISSTGVYGESQSDPYCEYSHVQPTTHYHRAKLLGEKSVLEASRRNLVLRTGWLFGGDHNNPKNFVANRLREAAQAIEKKEEVIANCSQRGCPTFTDDVATRLHSLIANQDYGVFNVVNEGNASRFEYVQAIITAARLNVSVLAADNRLFKRHAMVSSNEMAHNWRATQLGHGSLPNWQESLNRYIQINLSSRLLR